MVRQYLSCVALIVLSFCLTADDSKQAELAKKPHWQRMLTGENSKTAAKLEKRIAELEGLDDYGEAIKTAQELITFRNIIQGGDHYEAVNTSIRIKLLQAVAKQNQQDRALWRKTIGKWQQAARLRQQSRYEQALAIESEILTLKRTVLGDDHPDTATSYNNVALILNSQGKVAEAEAAYRRALTISIKTLGENHPDTAISYSNLASNLHAQGNLVEAQRMSAQALTLRRRLLGEDDPATAHSYNTLALILDQQGNHRDAQQLSQKSLEIYRKVMGEEHLLTARSYSNVAYHLNARGKTTEADQYFRKALDICSKNQSEKIPQIADCYNGIAFNLYTEGKTVEAQEYFQRALDIRRTLLGEDHSDTATSYNNLALNLSFQGHAAEAESLHRKALAISRKLLGEGHPHTSHCYINVAANLISLRQRSAAVDTLRSAVLSYEISRVKLAQGIERSILPQFNPRLLLAALRARTEPTAAWGDLEAAMARGLFDQQATMTRLNQTELQSQQQARNRIAAVQLRIVNNLSRSSRSRMAAQEVEQLLHERHTQEEILLQLGALDSVRAVEPSSRIQSVLSADAAILYWVDISFPVGNLQEHWACVLRNEGEPKWVQLPGTGEKGAWGETDQKMPGQVRSILPTSSPAITIVQKMHDQRIAPLLRHLKGAKTLHIVGTEMMAGIPIEALTPDFTVHYVPSGSYLARLAHRPIISAQLFLGVGDPTYPNLSDARELTEDSQLAKLNRGGDWAELPGTAAEIASLQTLFPQNTILTRKDANPKKLAELASSGKLKDFRYLHFATHGEANSVMAFQSSLILHGDDKSVARLTAREILDTWKLNAELVTLSACETAIGKDGGGDGLLGFAQAFLTAGARSVCLSLWKVDDGATALLMDRFYRNLLGKRDGLTKPMSKADALHEAKQWLRNLSTEEATARLATLTKGVSRGAGAKAIELAPPKPAADAKPEAAKKPFDHPRYWAAFILIGDPN